MYIYVKTPLYLWENFTIILVIFLIIYNIIEYTMLIIRLLCGFNTPG